jgi:phosphatidylserine/phosphatidylglycerophosphate/cardiolipin synthase-like enzyme
MIEGATRTIDFAQFYASNQAASRLEPIVQAVEAAARRGVRVRFLAEERFYNIYPETLERLGGRPGIEMRRYDTQAVMGGVLHAKYFIVDGREVYLGSQNFDWRALTHIQELGVRIRDARLSAPLVDLFETDWALAGGADPAHRVRRAPPSGPVRVAFRDDSLAVRLVFSPTGWLPDETAWDLPKIVELIDGARTTVSLQLLTYRAVGRDGTYFDTLESALRRAAARGVAVQIMAADWSKRSGTIEGLQSLQVVPGIEVKLVTIPAWSGGFVPYARVIHAKYLVVDDNHAWLGTSNWERSYFHTSRNVGLVASGRGFAAALRRYFLDGWSGPYAETVDPCARYEAPRIGE